MINQCIIRETTCNWQSLPRWRQGDTTSRGVKLFFKKGIKNFLLCSRLWFFITSPSLCVLGVCVCVCVCVWFLLITGHVNTETSFQGLILFLDGLLKDGNISKSIACVAGAKKGGANPLSLFPLFPSPFDVCCAGYKNRRKRRSPRPEKTFWNPPPLSKRLDDSPPPYLEVWIRHWEIHRGADLRHLHISQVPPYLPPKILHYLCFSFLLQVACITKLKLKKFLFDIVRLQAVNFIPALLLTGN